MKFLDLKPLSIARLKAYRRSINAKIGGYEICDCGSLGCDHQRELNKDNSDYVNLCAVRDRVNKELQRKQKQERDAQKNPAHVRTIYGK